MRTYKKGMKGLVMCLLGIWLLSGNTMAVSVCAQEATEISRIMTTQQTVDMKTEPDETAETIHSYSAGDSILVTGETQGWYRVRFQDLTGYIPQAGIVEMELDVTALDEQFAIEEEEGKMLVEAVEHQRDEARRSKIWGAVIVVLVLAIFATGIVSTMKGGKERGGKKHIIN